MGQVSGSQSHWGTQRCVESPTGGGGDGEQRREEGGLSGSWRHLCVSEGVCTPETCPGSPQSDYSASSPFCLMEDLWENST